MDCLGKAAGLFSCKWILLVMDCVAGDLLFNGGNSSVSFVTMMLFLAILPAWAGEVGSQ
jgi:hypothetical protein